MYLHRTENSELPSHSKICNVLYNISASFGMCCAPQLSILAVYGCRQQSLCSHDPIPLDSLRSICLPYSSPRRCQVLESSPLGPPFFLIFLIVVTVVLLTKYVRP